MLRANSSDELMAKREPYSAVYSATSPSVMVRGVACLSTWPTRKSSKKLPAYVLSLFVMGPCLSAEGGDGLGELHLLACAHHVQILDHLAVHHHHALALAARLL